MQKTRLLRGIILFFFPMSSFFFILIASIGADVNISLTGTVNITGPCLLVEWYNNHRCPRLIATQIPSWHGSQRRTSFYYFRPFYSYQCHRIILWAVEDHRMIFEIRNIAIFGIYMVTEKVNIKVARTPHPPFGIRRLTLP